METSEKNEQLEETIETMENQESDLSDGSNVEKTNQSQLKIDAFFSSGQTDYNNLKELIMKFKATPSEEQLTFPSSLTPHQRKRIHELVQCMKMNSNEDIYF